jgi:hypothetical protein
MSAFGGLIETCGAKILQRKHRTKHVEAIAGNVSGRGFNSPRVHVTPKHPPIISAGVLFLGLTISMARPLRASRVPTLGTATQWWMGNSVDSTAEQVAKTSTSADSSLVRRLNRLGLE